MKLILISFIILITSASLLSAQIATPSLDTSQKSDLAAAASWRFNSSIAIGYRSGSGKIKNNESTVEEFDQASSEALLAIQINGLTAEYGSNPDYERKSKINASGEATVTKTEQSQFNLAYRFNQNISLGGSYRTWESDSSNDSPTAGLKEETGIGEEKAYGIGISLRLLDMFFIAYGIDDVKHKADGYNDNKWQNKYMAGAILTDGGLRLEYAVIESPESQKTGAVDHNQYTNIRTTLEYSLFDEWLISYQKQEYTIEPINDGEDTEYEYSTYGIGMLASQGFSFHASVTNGKDKDNTFEIEIYRLAIAYNY